MLVIFWRTTPLMLVVIPMDALRPIISAGVCF